jgi:hydroxymethylpyrimidine/phosphomethylpyrimidine kinase
LRAIAPYIEGVVLVALTIAGSDPSGGAGIQADLKTFHQFGVYGEAAITLVTVQNTRGVSRVAMLDPELVVEQIRAVVEDIPPGAAKTGALGNAAMVRAVAGMARQFRFPLVVDPVMISKHGAPLLDKDAVAAVKEALMPAAELITPNLPEAEALTGIAIGSVEDAVRAGESLRAIGAGAALIKGGHFAEGPAVDVLVSAAGVRTYSSERIDTRHTHGTGCTYSAAIAAGLAQGLRLEVAVEAAKHYVTAAIATNPGLGSGTGPINHHAPASSTIIGTPDGETLRK